MPFTFGAMALPFPRWWGPFSPGRGKYSGFRFHESRLGTWVGNERGREFWPLVASAGADALACLVLNHYGGGRVLLLPNGLVIKPLQRDSEVGQRVLIGRFHGTVVLERPDGSTFDLSAPGGVVQGATWPGPETTGLECAIQSSGSLECEWSHPAAWGETGVREVLHPPDGLLAHGFRIARPGEQSGHVRVTANGHVITNCQDRYGRWVSMYVGAISLVSWPHRGEWIG